MQQTPTLVLLSVATLLISAGALRIGTAAWLEAVTYIALGVALLIVRERLKQAGRDDANGGTDP